MNYRYVDLENYPRRAQFEYFSSLAYPYVGTTVNVDITDFLHRREGEGTDFFLSLCYCVYHAANAVPEFRRRIKDGRIIEYEASPLSCTLLLPDESYCYCDLDCSLPYEEFLPKAKEDKERALAKGGITESEDVDAQLFISSLPWLSYTSLVQPVPSPADSNPRISWGRYFEQNGRSLIPVSVLCNHALMDGLHISRFYSELEKQVSRI